MTRALAAILMVLLAGCGGAQPPARALPAGVSQAEAADAYRKCHRAAENDVLGPATQSWEGDRSDGGFRDLDRQGARARVQALTESCMQDAGYGPPSRR